jgi:hypothetical protein
MEGLSISKTHPQNSPLPFAPPPPNSSFQLCPLRHEGFFFFLYFYFTWMLLFSHVFLLILTFWVLFSVYLQHPNPIGSGLAMDAIVEAAGPECIVPGQITPIKLLGLKVLLFPFHYHQKVVFF